MRVSFWVTITVIFVLYLSVGCMPPTPSSVSTSGEPSIRTLATPAVSTIAPTTPESSWDRLTREAKREGRVNLYTFLFSGDVGRAVARAFEERYSIKLEMVSGVGTVLTERIVTEQVAGKYNADIFDSAVPMLASAKERGILQSWGALPAFTEVDVWSRLPKIDEDGFLIALGESVVTPFVNTMQVRPGEEPKSTADLLASKWRGKKIAVASPVTTAAVIYWYVAKLVSDEYLTELAKNDLLIVPNVRDAISVLSRGEVAITFPYPESAAMLPMSEGAPIKPIELREGAVNIPSTAITLVKNAPHPNASRLFANWLLSKEGQTVVNRANFARSIRKDVPNFLPAAAQLTYKNMVNQGLKDLLEVSKLQRESRIAKLIGAER